MAAEPPASLWLRKPNRWELVFMALMAAFCGLHISDMIAALGAHACATPGKPAAGCYPWGAEGPVAGDWAYKTKLNYLVSGAYRLVVSVCTLVAPLVTASWRGTILLVGTILGLHLVATQLISSLL